jgi:hypothetical protein
VEPLGQNGWESPVLVFGRRTTLLFAPNGSGKTPIIQALASCLGFPSRFRAEILGKCAAATLEADVDGQEMLIRRVFTSSARDFHATISFGGEVSEYFSEGAFSDGFFRAIGLTPPTLVSTNKQATQSYVSTVLPLFYLNQGDGYTTAYKAPAAFIEDQFVEMVRFIFGLNPKHSYETKKSKLEEKSALEAITRKIVVVQRLVENQARGLDVSDGNHFALLQRASSLTAQINSLRSSVDANGAANSALIDLLKAKESQIRTIQTEINDLQSRMAGIDTIRAEIEGETKTLGLNEEARRIFISFQEICRSPNCGLFMGSTESYGKNLLYLRDQLKDLDRNAVRAEMRVEMLSARIIELRTERNSLAAKLQSPALESVDQLVTAVHALTKQLVDTESERASIEAVRAERSKLFRLEQERSRIQDNIEQLSASGRSDVEFNKLRLRLKELTVKWMDVLETQNVSRDIDIDLDFRFRFNGESLDAISGSSTKIRIVLAIHAALFEQYISEPTNQFRFLILDTPKQQELHTSDLSNYLTQLANICFANNAQLILSSTEYDHPTQQSDERWLPMYEGSHHPMYLGYPTRHTL